MVLVSVNFENFGLKKLISTSYAVESRSEQAQEYYQLSLFETESPQFDIDKTSEILMV